MSFVAETLSRTRKIRQFTNLCVPIFLFNDRADWTVVNAKRERVGADKKIAHRVHLRIGYFKFALRKY